MLFDYYCLGLRYLVMMTAMIVTTATQKNKIKSRLVFLFFYLFEPKTIGKGIWFFLTRQKRD
jgi:di/tricarboxylate transporter